MRRKCVTGVAHLGNGLVLTHSGTHTAHDVPYTRGGTRRAPLERRDLFRLVHRAQASDRMHQDGCCISYGGGIAHETTQGIHEHRRREKLWWQSGGLIRLFRSEVFPADNTHALPRPDARVAQHITNARGTGAILPHQA